MLVAAFGAVLMGIAFALFLANILWTLGWRNVVEVVVDSSGLPTDLSPASAVRALSRQGT